MDHVRFTSATRQEEVIMEETMAEKLDRLVQDMKATCPREYYQDGILNEEEAYLAAHRRFEQELKNGWNGVVKRV
jgi:hypothetical protein